MKLFSALFIWCMFCSLNSCAKTDNSLFINEKNANVKNTYFYNTYCKTFEQIYSNGDTVTINFSFKNKFKKDYFSIYIPDSSSIDLISINKTKIHNIKTKKKISKLIQLPVNSENYIVHIVSNNKKSVELYINLTTQLYEKKILNLIINIIITSIIGFIGLYHFIFYVFRPKDKRFLFSGLFSISFVVYASFNIPEPIFYFIFANVHLSIYNFIYNLSTFISSLFFVLYLYSIYPDTFSKKVVNFSKISALLFIILYLVISFTNILQFKVLNFLYTCVYISISIYILYFLIKSVRNKNSISKFILSGFVILFIFSELDIISNKFFSKTFYFTKIGTLLFFISVAFSLAYEFTKNVSNIEKISKKLVVLDKLNDKLILRLKNTIKKSISSEINFLQAQIKPHFLHNTLNTIVSLISTDQFKARELIINLSEFLRKCFDFKEENQLVTLEHEIDTIRLFMNIQQTRYPDKVQINYILPTKLTYKIPMLILQPIVENSFKHGILPKNMPGVINITIWSQEKYLCFSIFDNGTGIKKDRLCDLKNNKLSTSGIGIQNIDSRLQKLYNSKLEIQTTYLESTKITFKIHKDYLH
ncbi:MAG: histidine kinase [Clostridiales bacterium]